MKKPITTFKFITKLLHLSDNDFFSIAYEKNNILELDGNLDLITYKDYNEIDKIINDKNKISLNLYFDIDSGGNIELHSNDEKFLKCQFLSDIGGKIGVIFIDKKKAREIMNVGRINSSIINKFKSDMALYLKKITC